MDTGYSVERCEPGHAFRHLTVARTRPKIVIIVPTSTSGQNGIAVETQPMSTASSQHFYQGSQAN